VRNFLGCLRSGRICDHATLGATVATSADGRVVVAEILESSDAWRRGLRHDDEIVSLAGRPVRSVNAFKNLLGTLPAGWQVPVGYRRDGANHEMLARLSGVHPAAVLAALAAGGEAAERAESGQPARLPKAVHRFVDLRPAYANHHFAVVERDRVTAALAAYRDRRPPGPWVFVGTIDAGAEFRIELSDGSATIDLPTGTSTVAAGDDFERVPVPPGSGGMLPALVLWRRLVIDGPSAVGRTAYWGTAARDPARFQAGAGVELVDVLETSAAGVEARFSIDDSGRVVGIDLWSDPDADPCEVRLTWPADAAAVTPTAIAVSRRGRPFASFAVAPASGGTTP